MDTSCLRLRFTPLFKNMCKSNSKCSLEIVPEVSCIQNLDKIQWQHGDNTIEYTIPITYKVILKKKLVTKEDDDNAIKTYHSCVDLLTSSSFTILSDKSGYITKVLSDSLLLNKQSEIVENEDLKPTKNQATGTNINETQRTKHNPVTSSNTGQVPIKNIYKAKELKDEGTQFINNISINNRYHIEKVYLIDKITSTQLMSELGNHRNQSDIVSFNDTSDCVSSFACKMDRKLSLSPICSVNTDESVPDHIKGRLSNFIVLQIQEPKRITLNNLTQFQSTIETYGFETIKEIKNYDGQQGFDGIMKIDDKSFYPISNNSYERVLPEVRVADFMKAVEKELAPIKTTLNDIIRKCTLLGFVCKGNQNPMSYNYVRKKSKSNRVVYSFVFDG
ncbi:uncharacterized protein LOC106130849 [Amyelois transitella]|uniref:uncharacterized protein LOC106130849 n=1 Tax=Amyelois transitella TaxID=680683 RepID=UPI00298F80D0|nr:uncharacterized protein LOC106130849 [Amyelois transitella]